MEIDESGWADIDARLSASGVEPEDIGVLVDHLADRLVAHFGAEVIDCWVGKDGVQRHAMREVAAAAVAHLLPVVESVPDGTIEALAKASELGAPMPPPWDDHWRTQPRTASWRS